MLRLGLKSSAYFGHPKIMDCLKNTLQHVIKLIKQTDASKLQ
jgi:hypothetical protein